MSYLMIYFKLRFGHTWNKRNMVPFYIDTFYALSHCRQLGSYGTPIR
jgi:hypothetical protein